MTIRPTIVFNNADLHRIVNGALQAAGQDGLKVRISSVSPVLEVDGWTLSINLEPVAEVPQTEQVEQQSK